MIFRLFACSVALVAGGLANAQEPAEGLLTSQWGDPPPNTGQGSRLSFELTQTDGTRQRLNISQQLIRAMGGIEALDRKWVRLRLGPELLHSETEGRQVLDIQRMQRAPQSRQDMAGTEEAVSGSKPFITLPCKFSNVSAEPKDQNYFNTLYGDQPGALNNYWENESYNIVSVQGSQSQGWLELPNNRSAYVPVENGCFSTPANLNKLFDECVAEHDSTVNFPDYFGINLAFNDDLDGCAWGGSRWVNLDGVWKVYGVTWLPPWGYNNSEVLAHENGHAFGLPHSNNWDGDGSPYDNRWDYMSGGSTGFNPQFGTWPTGGMAHHKEMLGWLSPAEILVIDEGVHTVDLDPLDAAAATNKRMIKLPTGTSRFWTVEAREQTGDYESGVPGTAVLISEVETGRKEPIWVYDKSVPPADSNNNEGTMWKVGETFVDSSNDISVEILQSIPGGGFKVKVTRPTLCSPESIHLSNDTVDSSESYTACEISVGPSYEVVGPTGELRLEANIVRLRSGFKVTSGGRLTVKK